MSYLFVFSHCSWGSQGKNTEVVYHSLFQWTTFCQTSPPWPDCLGWPHTAWRSFTELDMTVVLWSDWLVVHDCNFSLFAFWSPLSVPTVLHGFLLSWTRGRWHNLYGRKWRRTKEPLDESDRGEWKSWLKAQHSENEDHGIRSHHFLADRWGNGGNSDRLYFLFWAPKSLQMVIAARKLKDTYYLEEKLWPT